MADLVIYCGKPAAGKTTNARHDGERYSIPVISKDTTNPDESRLADILADGPDDRDSPRYVRSVYTVTMRILGESAREFLDNDSSVIVDVPLLAEVAGWCHDGIDPADGIRHMWGISDDHDIYLVWHDIEPAKQYDRMVKRGAPADTAKLSDWGAYQEQLTAQLGDESGIREALLDFGHTIQTNLCSD